MNTGLCASSRSSAPQTGPSGDDQDEGLGAFGGSLGFSRGSGEDRRGQRPGAWLASGAAGAWAVVLRAACVIGLVVSMLAAAKVWYARGSGDVPPGLLLQGEGRGSAALGQCLYRGCTAQAPATVLTWDEARPAQEPETVREVVDHHPAALCVQSCVGSACGESISDSVTSIAPLRLVAP